ncbi:CPBP family intramembrane glutamic endopeptidase [Myceligenerans xiligouense]|uniref:CAAX prenyl protease 2/Lysostaphin resistance protein A-like domain-containing protein n=1 Tax=Myceligenerans xiligouense TaxID=253184 RepID=A0A3N4YN20_9MICO|nr:type II CAAX endopeptidase family protein [Myceligenerans xiligouense]RPF20734.1 hypothetical protein EDD34_1338 [Myceligenerans xiligouense]
MTIPVAGRSAGPTRTAGPARTAGLFFVGALICLVVPPLAAGVFAPDGLPTVLLAVAGVELVSAGALIAWWLRRHGLTRRSLGLTSERWKRDTLLAVATVPPRLVLEFGVLLPATGGAANPEVQEILRMASGGPAALAAALVLGIVGGGIAEELYFRGFLLGSIPQRSARPRVALWVAAVVSVVLFGLLHLPANALNALSITVAGLVYTGLFLATRRLTAPIVAHSLWNTVAIGAVLVSYG